MIKYTTPSMLRADFVIMKVLQESLSGLQPYTILKRSKLSGEVFFKVFGALAARKLIAEHDSLIHLTPTGREVFLAGSGRVLSGPKTWRQVPSRMKGRKIRVDDFYVPNIYLLDQ
ncbi:hypothetical protein [Pseudomonas syringae]|uniref:hypothetical protein n=1 Tax=Pseudomonas TaxID=286 RepID=UPI0011AEE107|nr:hypothetical protein [Pseudomonas syringae]MCF5030713.1 hypothetical protein [Pseudomonas syringae]MDF5776403.1 hypothetical protein [Pseudomonas syringae pv. syringae]UQB19624.1 hypothetical protein I9H08_22365 [Pseudomonas syringae pv. syringae]